jgi:ribosome maturation protein Sdo1
MPFTEEKIHRRLIPRRENILQTIHRMAVNRRNNSPQEKFTEGLFTAKKQK